MVTDKNGAELKTGDLVSLTAKVTHVFEGEGPGNIVIETVEAIVGGQPATFHTNGEKLVKVAE